MIWRAPISTLFPYTTLFRSEIGSHSMRHALMVGLDRNLLEEEIGASRRGIMRHLGNDCFHFAYPNGRLDRKSTRLNSSHANISYAVFCLKKKNKAHPRHSIS